ncbi:sugar/pyridoxal phosphate phosphatase YigL [Tatumella saanichensis]|uniref:sugar/pyridoxal phosphate phosphatase YigL n=1 Tax=Tatumella saanichensis TaxID=480813 RepID=UPI0004A23AC7|nr:sugar/pyridoxal phosphate phosphatase YigL [Tatumella saanichensis]
MYHIVASDLDGTLLSPDHALSDFTHKILNRLTEQDIHFVFATGRHHIDVARMRDKLGIDAYMITSNGARVHNPAGEQVFAHNLDEDIVADLYALRYDSQTLTTQVYRGDNWYISRDSEKERSYFLESGFRYQLYQPGILETDGISKVFFTGEDHQELRQLELSLVARWGDRVNVSFSLPTCLEVMAGGVSKGHALEAVATRLGRSLNDCIAFGDGMNDKEMLSMAAKGCIMQNAHQPLLDLFPQMEVIGSNAEDAVPRYLQRLYRV